MQKRISMLPSAQNVHKYNYKLAVNGQYYKIQTVTASCYVFIFPLWQIIHCGRTLCSKELILLTTVSLNSDELEDQLLANFLQIEMQ